MYAKKVFKITIKDKKKVFKIIKDNTEITKFEHKKKYPHILL